MSFLYEYTLTAFHRSIIGDDNGKVDEERGLIHDVPITLFINVNGNETRVGTVTLCGRAGVAIVTFQRQMHNIFVAHDKGCYLAAIGTAGIEEKTKSHAYPYTFLTMDEVPFNPCHLYSTGVFAWDSQAMKPIAPEGSPRRPPYLESRAGRQKRGRGGNEDDDAAVDMCGFNVTLYKRIDISVRLEHFQDVQQLLRDAEQTRAAELRASFCHPGLITAVAPIPSSLYTLLSSCSTLSTFWIMKKGERFSAMTVIFELWINITSSTCWELSASPLTWNCSQCLIKSEFAT